MRWINRILLLWDCLRQLLLNLGLYFIRLRWVALDFYVSWRKKYLRRYEYAVLYSRWEIGWVKVHNILSCEIIAFTEMIYKVCRLLFFWSVEGEVIVSALLISSGVYIGMQMIHINLSFFLFIIIHRVISKARILQYQKIKGHGFDFSTNTIFCWCTQRY